MDKLSNCFLSMCLGLWLVCLTCCQPKPSLPLYQKRAAPIVHGQQAAELMEGGFWYDQGSAAQQFMFAEALSHDSLNATLHREIGVPYLKRGIAAEFYQHYARAVELDPVDWQGWRGYLYLYFYRDYANALADFNATDTLTPDFVDYPQSLSVDYMRGIIYLQTGNYVQALVYFDKYIQHEIDGAGFEYVEPRGFMYKGITHVKMGELAEAKQAFQDGLKLDDRNANHRYWLAKIAVEEGKLPEATSWLTEAQDQWDKGYYYTRPYVEEFFQLYKADLDSLAVKVFQENR